MFASISSYKHLYTQLHKYCVNSFTGKNYSILQIESLPLYLSTHTFNAENVSINIKLNVMIKLVT